MGHFFGVLTPNFGRRDAGDEAPGKADFFSFGRLDDEGASRAEQDALFLTGKRFEPADRSDSELLRFVRLTLPRHY
ncbi:hypothetical protein [Devosia lacusdianchii]|uniref:hypothetical protein n=1 Tax=Devosia lacusdianchii TaxID=2917991 RepID=UPI001F05A7B9|nr:hypothetical protein [Devosia sp. JXJ CY 41]